MSLQLFDSNSVLSFRTLLTETTSEFLAVRNMSSPDTAEALGELVVALATYKEEGLPLFPQVFLLEDTNDIITLKGFDMRRISEGDRSRETMRRALKQCAPLCRGGWSIYFDLSEPHQFSYGLFRTDSSILASTPMERLRATAEPHCKILGISRLAENVIELSASAGYRRFIHLSGARTDVPHPTEVVEEFVKAVTADAKTPSDAFWAASVPTFFRHVFYDVMQAPYGCLAMVVPAGQADFESELLSDGVILAPQIDVISAIRSYYEDPSGSNATALQSVATLLKGMLSADGITVLRSDASLIGYNVFVRHHNLKTGGHPIGGARLRSYNVLCQHVGRDLTAAFYRSQDGVALCDTIFQRQDAMQRTLSAVPAAAPAAMTQAFQQPQPTMPQIVQQPMYSPVPAQIQMTPTPQPMAQSPQQPMPCPAARPLQGTPSFSPIPTQPGAISGYPQQPMPMAQIPMPQAGLQNPQVSSVLAAPSMPPTAMQPQSPSQPPQMQAAVMPSQQQGQPSMISGQPMPSAATSRPPSQPPQMQPAVMQQDPQQQTVTGQPMSSAVAQQPQIQAQPVLIQQQYALQPQQQEMRTQQLSPAASSQQTPAPTGTTPIVPPPIVHPNTPHRAVIDELLRTENPQPSQPQPTTVQQPQNQPPIQNSVLQQVPPSSSAPGDSAPPSQQQSSPLPGNALSAAPQPSQNNAPRVSIPPNAAPPIGEFF